MAPQTQVSRENLRGGTDPGAFLLHGVTGSGKTEIYLRAVAAVLEQGCKAIILVPEISLTPQTVARFAGRFPQRVAVLHSALTDGERYDTWRRARDGLVDIVVGPRSALFAPLSPLGLIVLDEEHDDSYKQTAPRPRYHTRDAALRLGRLLGATVVLGSATPSLMSYQRAKEGKLDLLEMPRRIIGHRKRRAIGLRNFLPVAADRPQVAMRAIYPCRRCRLSICERNCGRETDQSSVSLYSV